MLFESGLWLFRYSCRRYYSAWPSKLSDEILSCTILHIYLSDMPSLLRLHFSPWEISQWSFEELCMNAVRQLIKAGDRAGVFRNGSITLSSLGVDKAMSKMSVRREFPPPDLHHHQKVSEEKWDERSDNTVFPGSVWIQSDSTQIYLVFRGHFWLPVSLHVFTVCSRQINQLINY